MAEWVYRATKSKIDVPLAIMIALRGFMCRSVYNRSGRRTVSNVQHVRVGDVVHFYYVRGDRPVSEIGSFRIVAPATHRHPEYFGRSVGSTALYTVVHEELLKMLTDGGRADACDRDGYEADPRLGEFTGWPIERVGRAPKFDRRMFPGQGTLQLHGAR